MCIDIVKMWLGTANEQISSIFDSVICPLPDSGGILSFHVLFQNKYKRKIISKQYWPWSDAAFWGVRSGSALFAN